MKKGFKMVCATPKKKKKLNEELETQNEFMSKCISKEMKKGHPQEQAIAMCYSMWKTQ